MNISLIFLVTLGNYSTDLNYHRNEHKNSTTVFLCIFLGIAFTVLLKEIEAIAKIVVLLRIIRHEMHSLGCLLFVNCHSLILLSIPTGVSLTSIWSSGAASSLWWGFEGKSCLKRLFFFFPPCMFSKFRSLKTYS